MLHDKDFIVFADDWGRHPSSCQHIFKRLAQHNRVLWVNTVGMRLPAVNMRDIGKILDKVFACTWHREKGYENLIVFSPWMLPSFKYAICREINKVLLSRQIKGFCKRHRMIKPVLVTTIPIVADLVGQLSEAKTVYYCVDDFSKWPGMMKKTLAQMESTLVDKVDLILAASDRLYHDRKYSKCPVYLFQHGVDFEHFMKASLEETQLPEDIADIKRPIIGLCGSFDVRTDFNIIRHIAMVHSDWSIVFIGPMLTKPKQLSGLKNVVFLGPRPHRLLPNYLKAIDVCIIPYKVSDGSILNSSPVKLREYLAAGKPVISTPIPEVKKFKEVKIAHDKDEFVESIELAMKENGEGRVQARQKAVMHDNWHYKTCQFSRYVEQLLNPSGHRPRESRKIKIMHLASAQGAGGGPDKTILLSSEKINKQVFEPIVVYLKGAGDKNFAIEEKARSKGLNFHAVSEQRRIDSQAIRKVKQLSEDYQVDILHCHGYKADCLGLLLSRHSRMRLITTTHGWFANDCKERFYNWIDKKTLKYYDYIIAVCEKMRYHLLDTGVPPEKLKKIHNGVDVDNFHSNGDTEDLRTELKIDKNVPVLGVVGRLSAEKRVESLFDILKEVIAKIGDVKLLIAGDGPLKTNLQLKARNLNLRKHVFFLGQCQDIKRVYKTIDSLVSISSTEGLPNNILEALAMETPVLATKVGGIDEIITDGLNGLLFPPEDKTGITRGIADLLSDRRMAADFARKGRELVCKRFSFDERMRKIEELYKEVV